MKWFSSLSKAGVGYSPAVNVDRRKLAGFDVTAKVRRMDYGLRQSDHLVWSSGEGRSPAARHAAGTEERELVPRDMVHRIAEALELPGTAIDYHFAIQACLSLLWQARFDEGWIPGEIERLCRLDLRLVDVYQSDFRAEFAQNLGAGFIEVSATWMLLDLFEGDGYLREAMAVIELARRLNQAHEPRFERIARRLAALEQEDAG